MNGADSGAWGVVLLASVTLLSAGTGLAIWLALILTSVVGAAIGCAAGVVDLRLLGALPSRITGLLESDLLQAVPLFVLVGSLLERLPLADIVFRAAWRLAGRGPAAPRRAAIMLAALVAPMNGSVGASSGLLARVVGPRLAAVGEDTAARCALVAGASTLGVLVPPSLVLLLLGDALMRADTEAVAAGRQTLRIVNTQDLMHAALLPALLVVLGMGIVAAWPRRAVRGPVEAPTGFVAGVPPPLSRREAALAMLTVATEALLLGGVAVGYVHAVEAAATGCALLLIGGWVTGRLPRAALADVLVRTAGVAGGLFALFVGATTFTLLLRALGTDRWLVHAFAAMDPGHTLALALGVLVACALVLDAFELIFVVVPLLLPPVLLQVGDAAWVGVLVLLALQLGFIVPPLGYAVMMSSAAETSPPRLRALASALWPTQAVILAVLALLVALPRLVHLADPSSSAPAASAAPDADEAEIERRMREMSAPRAP